MWNLKKGISCILAGALTLSLASPLSGMNAVADTADPWKENAKWPELTSRSDLKAGQKYFTYKEWTGEVNSTDIAGKSVRQSDVYQVNREEHTADTLPYDSVEAAVQGAVHYDLEQSPYYQLLTGEGEGQQWALTVYKNVDEATAAGVTDHFYKLDYTGVQDNPYHGTGDVSVWPDVNYGCGWRSVTLPASWQSQGFDFPIYGNTQMPWVGQYGNAGGDNRYLAPAAPTVTNPTGFYRRYFDVDPTWLENGKKVYISFQGVESAMYLYINGHEVGYSEDMYDEDVFDITPFLNADGEDNLLAVRVHRWSDGSWLEDQDSLRLGGIFRDVYLYATPAVHIQDYTVETDLDEDFVNAELKLEIEVSNQSTTAAQNFGVDVKLFDATGANLFASRPLRADVAAIRSDGKVSVALNRGVTAPRLWSDEDPYLYTLVISLYDKNSGKLFESISQQLGFREITFTKTVVDANYNNITESYQQMLLNGKPLLFKGVNMHGIDPDKGKYVSRERMETDLTLMKAHNLNAVRTSHYPADRYFYHLANKYGILVLADASMEAHTLAGSTIEVGGRTVDTVGHHFTEAYNDRTRANVERHKNDTCVVMWSLGNEAGNSPYTRMFEKSIQEIIRPTDPTRPVVYLPLGSGGGVDVNSSMYASVDSIENVGKNGGSMPYLEWEYSHAMGNASGNLMEYWEVFRAYDNLLGAFIWDWVDQNFATPIPAEELLLADESANGFKGVLDGAVIQHSGEKALRGNVIFPASKNDAAGALNTLFSQNNAFTIELDLTQFESKNLNAFVTKGDHQVGFRSAQNGNGHKIVFFVYTVDGAWAQNEYAAPADWLNRRHQIAATFDGVNMAVYCDGVALRNITDGGEVKVNRPIATSNVDFSLNYDMENPDRFGQNDVYGLRIYNKALTAAELTAQAAADQTGSGYIYDVNSENIMMWLDFDTATVDKDGDYWDYYESIGREDMADRYYAYGSDWGDTIHHYNYCNNGLISSDRTPQPELREVQYVYQNVWFTASTADVLQRKVEIYNENRFVTTEKYAITWNLTEDGKVVDSGVIDEIVQPMERKTVTVPYQLPEDLAKDGEYFLNFSVKLKDATEWCEAGHEAATEQLSVPAEIDTVKTIDTAKISAITKSEQDGKLRFAGEKFTLTFDPATGLIEQYIYDGAAVITGGPSPNYWRARVDNDQDSLDTKWQTANEGMVVEKCETKLAADGKTATVDATLKLPGANNSTQTISYTLYGSGEITVAATLTPGEGMGQLLRYGAEITLPGDYENIYWYGAGPEENYQDRNRGAHIGLYETTVSDSFYPFVLPQDCGNHTNVRYMALESEKRNIGLMVVGSDLLEAGALHFSTKELTADRTDRTDRHPYQLPQTDHTVLNVALKSRGLGGNSCGPQPLSQYLLQGSEVYSYEYTIVPYEKGADRMATSKLWRDADVFDQAEFDKAEAGRIDALIREIGQVLYFSQKDRIIKARSAYEKLTDVQKALVSRYDELLEAEESVMTLYGAKAYVTDHSENKLEAEITDTAVIMKDDTSPTGYAMEGYFEVPNERLTNEKLSGNVAYTLEVWVNPADLGDGNVFIAKGDHQTTIKTSNGGIEFFIHGADDRQWHVVNPPYPAGWSAGEWHHVVGTYDGRRLCLYVDGALIGSTETTQKPAGSTVPLGIGRALDDSSGSRTLRGKLAVARVYTVALTADQVAAQYNADKNGVDAPVSEKNANMLLEYDFTEFRTEGGQKQKIESLQEIHLATQTGVAPILPDTVPAVFDDGTIMHTPVRWDKIDPKAYAAAGEFTVQGLVGGTSKKATAIITVGTSTEFISGDVDKNDKVDVADIMKLKALIMADKWSEDELLRGDMDESSKLDVGDIMAIKNIIMSK